MTYRIPETMSRLSLRLLLLLPVFFAVTGCASSRNKERKPDAAPAAKAPRRVGTVSTVRSTLGFVLIDGAENLRAGSVYRTVHPSTREETGVLTISQQQSPPFFLGDITAGSPEAGDWLIAGDAPAQPASSAATEPGHPLQPSGPATAAPSMPPLPALEPLPDLPPLEPLAPLEPLEE